MPINPTTGNRLVTEGGGVCPVCAHPSATPGLDLGDFDLFECAVCGCWASDALARGAMLSFEPASYFAHADADRHRWDALLRRIRRGREDVSSALDVGCGTGAFLHFVGERFPESRRVGIEIDPVRAAEAGERNPTARILVGDVRQCLHGVGGPFDLITLWDVFEHLVAPADLLADLAHRLAPKGRIYIQTIHEHSLVPTLGRLVYRASRGRWTYAARRTHDAHHLVFFTRRGLRIMADRAGLRIGELWFDRLARDRMDGHPLVVVATSAALAVENLLGNGLFVNLLLDRGGS